MNSFGLASFVWASGPITDGVQFSHDPEALNQYFRQMTPDTGPFDVDVMSDAVSALFNRIGRGILVTHSHSGGLGWSAAMKNENIMIVSFEPGSNFVFPEGEVPDPMPSSFDTLKGIPVPMSDFMAADAYPDHYLYGDNIPDEPSDVPAQDAWRVRLAMARKWRDTVNRHSSDVTMVHLPVSASWAIPTSPSDLNNVQIADQVSTFLAGKSLD